MARFENIYDIVDSLCLREGDLLRTKKGVYLDVANDVWNDLNFDVLKQVERYIKEPKRRCIYVNKKTNSVDLPCNYLQLSSVNVMLPNGVQFPVFRNDRLHDDIVDVGATKDCHCEHNCGGILCNLVKGYEAVETTYTELMPDSTTQTFIGVNRKCIDDNGNLIEEKQEPVRVYTNGTWTGVQLETTKTTLCAFEVNNNGCICDTEENEDRLCKSFQIDGIPFIPNSSFDGCVDEWKFYAERRLEILTTQCGGVNSFPNYCNNIYNFSELGDRLIFPKDFGFEKIVIRYYADIELSDLEIPYMAKDAFMSGLQYFASIHDMSKANLMPLLQANYAKRKGGLLKDLNKYRIAELRTIITPPTYVPSKNVGSYGLWSSNFNF